MDNITLLQLALSGVVLALAFLSIWAVVKYVNNKALRFVSILIIVGVGGCILLYGLLMFASWG